MQNFLIFRCWRTHVLSFTSKTMLLGTENKIWLSTDKNTKQKTKIDMQELISFDQCDGSPKAFNQIRVGVLGRLEGCQNCAKVSEATGIS